jgi:phage terminase large subunit
MITLTDTDLYLPDFCDIWFTNCNARYRALKGGRETGKTFNFIGYEVVFKILSDERRNILMIRNNAKDNRGSSFSMIISTLRRLKIMHLFKITYGEIKITRKDTGQEIRFAGMNDVENITSTSFSNGYWTDIYFEEASQLESYEEFRVVDGSLRIPSYESDLKAQITFLFNAWDVGHWLYDIFFKDRLEDDIDVLENKHYQFYEDSEFSLGAAGKGLALHISSVWCNPYINEEKKESILKLKETAYDIYLVEGLGCWGNRGDSTYPYFKNNLIINQATVMNTDYSCYYIGIDIGGTNGAGKIVKEGYRSAMTMELTALTHDFRCIDSVDEWGWSNEGKQIPKEGPEIAEDMIRQIQMWKLKYAMHPQLMKGTIVVYVESADPGDFQGLLRAKAKELGLDNVVFKNSTKIYIQSRVDFDNLLMSRGEHRFCENCKELIREYKAAHKDEEGFCRADKNDHFINGSEYSWQPMLPKIKLWSEFKPRK